MDEMDAFKSIIVQKAFLANFRLAVTRAVTRYHIQRML